MNDKAAILIVDDEQDLREALTALLERHFPSIISACDGLDALEKLKDNSNIRAIISDIKMPKMDGLELLKKIRSEYNPIPFVILTGYGDPTSMRLAVQLNATDFLDKPIKGEELISVAKKALEYGESLASIEKEIDEMYKNSNANNVEFLKRVKRTAMAMRAESAVYIKKA